MFLQYRIIIPQLILHASCQRKFTVLNCKFLSCVCSTCRAVHVADFTSHGYQILTGSDDYTCRLWDIPNSAELTSYKEHTDYIRCGITSKLNRDLFFTGKIWC